MLVNVWITMKTGIHPTWHNDVTVTCSCGETFVTGSTMTEISTDICSKCHPFFTGEMRFVDVQGRVEKFQAKLKASKEYRKSTTTKKAVKQLRQKQAARSLKDVLTEMKQTQDKQTVKSETPDIAPKTPTTKA